MRKNEYNRIIDSWKWVILLDDKNQKRYEYLKKKKNEEIEQNKWRNNELFMDFIQKIDDVNVISDGYCKLLLERLTNIVSINSAGHIDWYEAKCDKGVVEYDQLGDYVDVSKQYFIIWDDYDLPVIKCRLQSIIDNVDDIEAVTFSYLVISEDFKVILESKKFGFINIGIF